MPDLLDLLKKETLSENKLFKVERKLEDYSEACKQVVFEKRVLRKDQEKELFLFHESLNSLRKRGYARHSRPNEAFSLLCSHLEGDLSVKTVAEDMLSGCGEWLSLAMKYQNNLLHCYVDPELEFNQKQNKYTLKNCNSEMLFPMSELEEHSYIQIKELHAKNPEFVEFIWSRSFDKLPLEIQKNASLYLYTAELVWPVGRDYYINGYYISSYCNCRASRGVAPKIVGHRS